METIRAWIKEKGPFTILGILLSIILSLLAFRSAYLIQQNGLQEAFPWQQEKIVDLLNASGIWFAGLAIVLAAAVWLRRRIIADLPKAEASEIAVHWPWIVLAVLIALYIAVLGLTSIERHRRFNSTGYDLAIKEQVIWNTLHGRFFASSPEVDNAFQDHFQPIMLALVPLYALFPSPQFLIWVQTIGLAAGAIPLFVLARRRLQSPTLALALSAGYLLTPTLGYMNRFDFHPEILAIPAFLAAFEALDRDDWTAASIWLVVPLLSKENLGFTVAAFGLYALVFRRNVKFGLAWTAVGVAISTLTMFWLIPTLRDAPSDTLSRYGWLGSSPPQMVKTLLTQPGKVWDTIADPTRGLYLLQLLLPTGFLVLIGLPEFLIAVPGLTINLLAHHYLQNTIYCQYTVPILPFLSIATVMALSRMKRHVPRWTLYVVGIGCLALSAFAFHVDTPLGQDPTVSNPEAVRDALAVVPDGVSLVTTNAYAPHLAHREELYILGFPSQREPPTDPQMVFVNLYDQRSILCDGYREYFESLDLDRYGTIFRDRGLIVLQRDGGVNDQFRDFILNWNNCAG